MSNSSAVLIVGTQAEASFEVRESDTARALSLDQRDDFPPVFATSRMIALMELAAARLMKPLLQDGELSVGVTIEVRHTAATPIGHRVRAVAQYAGQEGKLHRFTLEAFDEEGLVGSGTHSRAVVATSRLMTGALRRARTQHVE